MHPVTKLRIVPVITILSLVFKSGPAIALLNNSSFCLSTQIVFGNFTNQDVMFPYSSQVGIIFRLPSDQNYFLKSNSSTKLPFVSKHAVNCYVFNIFLSSPISSFHSNDMEVAIAVVRIIRNSSFGFDEENVHFLIHLDKLFQEKENGILSLFAGGGSFELENLDGDDDEKNELSTSAKITFAIHKDIGDTLLKPYCYQCPSGTRLSKYLNLANEFALHQAGSFQLFQTLSALHKSLEMYEDRKAYVFSKTGGEVDHINDDNCTRQSTEDAGIFCYSSHKKLNVTATLLNMTLVAMGTLDRPENAGLYFCLLCNPRDYYAQIYNPPPILHNDNFKKFNVIYCHYGEGFFEKPKWLMLCRPFDRYIWLGIFITCFVMGVLKQDSSYGLDVFVGIINQPVQKPWTMGMATIFLILIVLTNGYLGIVTRDLTKPIQERRIETIEELLKDGKYKLVVEDQAMATVFLKQFLEPVKPNLTFTSANYQIIPNLSFKDLSTNYLQTIQILARYHGAFGIPDMSSLKPLLRNGFRIQSGNASCTSITETLPTQMQWMLRLNFAGRAYSVLERLQIAGLGEFWEKTQKQRHFATLMLKTMDSKTSRQTFEEGRPEALVLESSPKIVFLYYCGLNAVAIFSFCYELLFWNKQRKIQVIIDVVSDNLEPGKVTEENGK